jgi:alanyl-tRNA synthetase
MGVQAGSGKGTAGDTYSLELCGGTHVTRLGEIGAFVLLGDSASAAGVRRIEALTGADAMTHMAAQSAGLTAAATALKTTPAEVSDRIKTLMDERKALQNEVAQLRREVAMSGGGAAPAEAQTVNGVAFFAQALTGVSGKDLPALIDEHKSRLGSGAVVLVADLGGKVAVAAGVTDDLKGTVSAVDLVKAAVAEVGGKGGGGRPDMAQGGGKDFAGADKALEAAKAVIGG